MEPNLLSVFEKLFPKLRNEPNANKVLDYLVALPGNQGLAGLEILCDILDIKVDANLGEYNVNQEVKAEIREKLSDLLKQSL